LAAKYSGEILEMYKENLNPCSPEQNGVAIEKISEENVRLLADDPRIDRVQAVFQYYPA